MTFTKAHSIAKIADEVHVPYVVQKMLQLFKAGKNTAEIAAKLRESDHGNVSEAGVYNALARYRGQGQ
jgi:hypothetical protein